MITDFDKVLYSAIIVKAYYRISIKNNTRTSLITLYLSYECQFDVVLDIVNSTSMPESQKVLYQEKHEEKFYVKKSFKSNVKKLKVVYFASRPIYVEMRTKYGLYPESEKNDLSRMKLKNYNSMQHNIYYS